MKFQWRLTPALLVSNATTATKTKMAITAPRRAGTMNNRIVEGMYLARAAQQRQQLRAQRQARDQRAGQGKKYCRIDECRSHTYDYKDFSLAVQQIL